LRVEHRELADLAASVADGVPVDWSTVELRANPSERRLASHLRLVESIASLHRSIPPNEDDSDVARAAAGPSGRLWGRLTLLERIGEGTSCDVYRAWDTGLHREVALKLLHDEGDRRESHDRVMEEARRLARVRHSHVVQVYGAEEHDRRVGLWMELVRGESLEQIVRTRGLFGAREAALIGLDLCAALAAVHGAQLLHRDVKAQNVMREEGGRIVLMDFGTGEELSGTNRLVGTPLYLAPEVFSGDKASAQSDLYSLGVLLFYLVTGKFPVTATSMEQLARAHTRGERHSVRDLRPDLPQAFVRTIERALEPDLSRRFRSAGEMEAALGEAAEPQAVVREALASPAITHPPHRWRGVALLAAGLALLGVVVGLSLWGRANQASRGAALSAIRTIAVLPTLSAADAQLPEHFARGFADELMSLLGQVPALSVKSGLLTGFDNRPRQTLASALDVDALLETTLSGHSGDSAGSGSVSVRARLLAAGTGAIVWTDRFERPRGETQALQADIAEALAAALGASPPASLNGLRQRRQTNPEAEEAYLAGRAHLDQYGTGSAELALRSFERALGKDPGHAAAHVGAARARISLGLNGATTHQQARADALAAVTRALAIDPNLAEAHATLAHIHFIYDWQWSAAEQAFVRSLELNPSLSYGRTFYAEHLAALGRFDEALEQAQIAKRLDPESGAAARRYGLVLYYKHSFAEAEQARFEAVAIEPNAPGGPLLEGRIFEAAGRFHEALDSMKRAAQLSGGGGVPLRAQIVRLEALAGNRAEAMSRYRELQRESETRAIRLTDRDRAYIELAFGRVDKALDLLERAVDDRDPTVVWIGVDPRLDTIRSDERFKRLLGRIGLPLTP
jgi:eukaryotic-like serine/threonine-protein kinase